MEIGKSLKAFESFEKPGNLVVLDETTFSVGHRDTSNERKARFFAIERPVARQSIQREHCLNKRRYTCVPSGNNTRIFERTGRKTDGKHGDSFRFHTVVD